jgi:hypothetical protein
MIEIITILAIMVIIFFILFWLKKTIFLIGFFFKLFLFAILVMIVASFVFGYIVIKDANDFKNNFSNSTSMMVVKQTNNGTTSFLAGATLNPEGKEFNTLNKKQLATVEKLYQDNKLDDLGDDYYKVFLIELKSFDDVELYNISDQNVELSKAEIKAIMLSDNAREDLARIVAKKNGKNINDVYKELSGSDEEIKGYILSYYLSSVFNSGNISGFMTQLKKDNISVYANTALFKTVRYIPQSLINVMVNKPQNSTNKTI